jgi:exosortase N
MVLLVIPFVLYIKNKKVYSLRYGLLSILFLLLYPFLKVQSCFFLGYVFFLLFIVESHIGKLNNLPIFLIAIISPFAIFVFEIFGFPIRLQLTEAAANILSMGNVDIVSKGNVIKTGGYEFSVDPECMGLKMVISGFLISLAIIAYYEKKTKKSVHFILITVLLGIATFLIVLCNFFRIIGVIIFKALPGTFMHEVIGLASLIIYVMIHAYFITKIFFKYLGKPFKALACNKSKSKLYSVLTIVIIVMLAFMNYNREGFRNVVCDNKAKSLYLEGFSKGKIKGEVTKFENDTSLIYIKPSSRFYGADHTPIICWKGSGYKFKNEQIINIGDYDIYFAELHSDNDMLYTTWWYDNGKHRTIKQFDWRWRMLRGEEAFRLINVTCLNKADLIKETNRLLSRNLFR